MYGLMINNTLGAYVAIVLAMLIILIFWRVNKGRLHPLAFAPIVITIVITYLSYMNVITNIWGETIGNCIGQFWRDLFTVVEHAEGFEQAGTNRMMLWLATLEIIPQKPIFGFGNPHNDYGRGFYCTESESLSKEPQIFKCWSCIFQIIPVYYDIQ